MKRTLDLLLAVIGAIVTAPIILVLVILIRRTSAGPGLFRQARVGRNEKIFTCFKLRTMSVGTGDRPSHETATSSITPLGQFLRRTKLDELPQLWNIVRGDMSLVGPRPCLPSQSELIRLRREKGLYAIRPGITGISQVRRVDMSIPERLAELDATYLADMSPGADLRLIWMTVTGAGRGDAAVTTKL